MAELDDLIVCTPGTRGGKPRIAERRITVADVALMHLRRGMSVQEIVEGYDLSPASVHAALAYYYENQRAIDRSIQEDEAFAEDFQRKHPSLLQQKLRSTAER